MSQAVFEQAARRPSHRHLARDHAGRDVHPYVVEVMRELGFDLSERRPQLLTRKLAEQPDLNRYDGLRGSRSGPNMPSGCARMMRRYHKPPVVRLAAGAHAVIDTVQPVLGRVEICRRWSDWPPEGAAGA